MRALILVFGSILHFSYELTVGINSQQDYTYLKDSNSMYKYHVVEKSWVDAKIACAYEGASLFVPEDKAEVTAVQELFKFDTSVWVGISKSRETFRTLGGRPLSNDTDWFRLDISNNESKCITMWSGKFSNYRCDYTKSFICKYKPEANALALPSNCGTSSGAVQTVTPQAVTPQTLTHQTASPQTETLQSVLCDHNFGEGNRTADHTSRTLYHFKEVIGEELNNFPPSEILAVKTAVMNAIMEQWQRINSTNHETIDLTFGQETF